jgi:hypothetical protein
METASRAKRFQSIQRDGGGTMMSTKTPNDLTCIIFMIHRGTFSRYMTVMGTSYTSVLPKIGTGVFVNICGARIGWLNIS